MSQTEYRQAASMIVVRKNQILLVWLKDSFVKGWVIPSGGIKAGESIYDAALRELREETGVLSEQLQVLGKAERTFRYDFPSDQMEYWSQRGSPYRGQERSYVVGRLKEQVELSPQDRAVEDARWVAFDDLGNALFQPGEAVVVRAAIAEFARLPTHDQL